MTSEETGETQSEEVAIETTSSEETSVSYLSKAIEATTQTPEDATKALFKELVSQAMEGTVTWDKNVPKTIENAIAMIDQRLSKQLSAVMQKKAFQKLEGSWRGLSKLVKESDLGPDLKIQVIDYTKDEFLEQFEDAPAIDRSPFFNLVYQEEFGTAGGEPFGVFIGDYEFSAKDDDVALMRYMAEVASVCHAPFIAAANAHMFEYDDYTAFNEGRPIASGFISPSYAAWNAFRESDDARYVALTLPRVMARLPYGQNGGKTKAFDFEEIEGGKPANNGQFVWSNASYELGLKMTEAFRFSGWCTAIRGVNNGGKVENLPNYCYLSDADDEIQQCPSEVNLTDEREKELSDLGFLPLVHYKSTNYGVFIGGQTIQKPKEYTDKDATANAAISARLPYIMASGRIAHYLKVMGRDKLGSNVEATDIQKELDLWIGQYTNAGALGDDARAKTPLKQSKIEVVEQPGKPGSYSAVAYLLPWLQMEELTTSVRMVAKIPG